MCDGDDDDFVCCDDGCVGGVRLMCEDGGDVCECDGDVCDGMMCEWDGCEGCVSEKCGKG